MERIFVAVPGCSWAMPARCRNPAITLRPSSGRQPVIMVRHRDGSVHVLLNRCTHRGAKVVNGRTGERRALDLLLSRLELRDGWPPAEPPYRCRKGAADFDKAAFGLARAPRVEAFADSFLRASPKKA